MHTFANKQKSTQEAKSTRTMKPSRAFSGQSYEISSILHLQRKIENQSVQRLLQSNTESIEASSSSKTSTGFAHDFSRIPVISSRPIQVQPKLTVNTPGDRFEQEADRVADQVMRIPDPKLQRACGGSCPRCRQSNLKVSQPGDKYEQEADRVADQVMRMPEPQLRRQPVPDEEEEDLLQTKRDPGETPEVTPALESYLAGSRGSGQPLPDFTRAFFEPRFGHDFSRVRVHTDSRADQASGEISARAFATGTDIYLAQGQYKPGTEHGHRLLAHELTHVLQQSAVPHLATHTGDHRAAQRAITPVTGLPVQRVADKSDVPAMVCTPDPAPGRPAGRAIMFGSADNTLDNGDKTRIATEHAAWLARGGIDALIIDGFASSEGTARGNWELSCERAEAVKAEFVRLGVPATMVTTIAHGETEEFSAASRSLNRRAVVRTVAGTAPTVIVFPVVFGTTANRVSPGRTVPVIVVAAGIPAGRSIDLDIQGSGGGNGTATVAPATITGSAVVAVTGGVQTTPGSAGNLRVRSRMGGLTLASSPGFTVAAHPTNFSVTLNSDLNTPTQVGLLANNNWTSDGTGGAAELDQIRRGEAIQQGRQDRPPFFSGLGPPSGKSPGNTPPRVDTHSEPRAAIRTSPFLLLSGTRFIDVVRQLFIFDDARTGLLNQTAVDSGFTITSTVSFNAIRVDWDEQTVKTGAATTVGARSATAGSGTATSLVHPL